MALSALLSTFLAIWLTKNDILEDDFLNKKAKFGIITFEEGYKSFLIMKIVLVTCRFMTGRTFLLKK